jgi:hypothetical protein
MTLYPLPQRKKVTLGIVWCSSFLPKLAKKKDYYGRYLPNACEIK